MDHIHASLNPCSLETIPLPVTLGNGCKVWPLMLSCYQLDDATSPNVETETTTISSLSPTLQTANNSSATTNNTSQAATATIATASVASGNHDGTTTSSISPPTPRTRRRRGRVDFYTIAVPDLTSNHQAKLSFGKPYNVLGEESSNQQQFSVSGVLDGKWAPIPSSSPSSSWSWAFATAHSTGEIQIHSFQVPKANDINSNNNNNNNDDDDDDDDQQCTTLSPPFIIRKCIGQSEQPPRENYKGPAAATTIRPLCLSVNWSNKQINHHHQQQHDFVDVNANCNNDDDRGHQLLSQIVSTYSNGKVAIHDVAFLPQSHDDDGVHYCSFNCSHCSSSSDGDDADTSVLRAQVMERDSWFAHSMFTSPAEVWSADFCNIDNTSNNTGMIMSCGDEGKVKFWDVRSQTRPVLQVHVVEPFEAGATCAASHPRKPNIVAVGSYDETVCLYDVRYFRNGNNSCLGQSETLGGGIWRIKWHPYSDNRLLVAAMHCGCRVLKIQALSGGDGGGQEIVVDVSHQQHDDPFLHDTITTSTCSTTTSHSPSVSIKPIKTFTQNESMAYGADWLVCRYPTQNGYFEAAASCSFYDRSVFLWDSVVI